MKIRHNKNEARNARIRKRYAEGQSLLTIAHALDLTRQTVSGVVMRAVARGELGRRGAVKLDETRPPVVPSPYYRPHEWSPPPNGRAGGVRLLDARECHCRWIGSLTHPAIICGKPVYRRWLCAEHYARSIVLPKPRGVRRPAP